jgi:hypothetical protein
MRSNMEKIISHRLINPSNDQFLTWTFATEPLKIAKACSGKHTMRLPIWNNKQEPFWKRSDETS